MHVIRQFFFILVLGLFFSPTTVTAECFEHIVTSGDTFVSISKMYFGTYLYWEDIQRAAKTWAKPLKPGLKIKFFVPSDNDWDQACLSITQQHLTNLHIHHQDHNDFAYELINGIVMAEQHLGKLSPTAKLEVCRWALATAQQESNYEFAVGSAGEIGLYQFKLDTVRLTLRWFKIINVPIDDEALVYKLLDTANATEIFAMHFCILYKRAGNLFSAWKRYNNGPDAEAYANQVLEKYRRVRRIVPFSCEVSHEAFSADPVCRNP